MVLAVLLVPLLFSGCSQGVRLVQETERGGVVDYYVKEHESPMSARYRADAIKVMEEKCRGRYTVLREGATHGHRRVLGIVGGTEDDMVTRYWGIKFQCQ